MNQMCLSWFTATETTGKTTYVFERYLASKAYSVTYNDDRKSTVSNCKIYIGLVADNICHELRNRLDTP